MARKRKANRPRAQETPELHESPGPASKRPRSDQSTASTFTTPQGQVLPRSVQKFWRRRHDYFWKYDERIQIDEIGWYSVTHEVIAEDTAARVSQLYNHRHPAKPSTKDLSYGRLCVVDAFCGVGGNTIKFATWCEHVIAIDIDETRLEMARHNARVYGVEDRIEFILGDFYKLAPMLSADIVYLSPPWGGLEYNSTPVFDLDSLPFHTAQEWMDRARMISENVVYYLPRNCDPNQLADLCPDGSACDVELNYIDGYLKAITAYYGDLAVYGSLEPRILEPTS
ncbi:RNA methylase protein [Coemansia erecta]|nr:RNA methylase protein [Coemansia erecta]